jgi:hypothetical protein
LVLKSPRTGSDDDLVTPETPSPPPRLSRGLKDVALLRGAKGKHDPNTAEFNGKMWENPGKTGEFTIVYQPKW